MPIDFDHLVNKVCMDTFGSVAQTGKKWTYTLKSGAKFDIDLQFYEAWAQTDQGQGKKTYGAVSTTAPLAMIRVSDWAAAAPAGAEMNKNDMLTDPSGVVWRVENQNPDGAGMIQLALTKTAFR